MGRKIKPIGLRRKAISISLPLDVISHLDNIVLSTEGATRSRLIESVLRTSMTKGQTTLGQRWVYRCKECDFEGISGKLNLVWCKSCSKESLYISQKVNDIGKEEEE